MKGKKRILCALLVVFTLSSSIFVNAASWRILKRGDAGTNVRTLQYLLRSKEYSLSIDGDFGPTTERCVRDFQAKKGLVSDGIVGTNTWLKLAATLQVGTKSNAVRALQIQLQKCGYDVNVDGDFGLNTERCVRYFQSKMGLASDGIVGPNTWRTLINHAHVTK